MPTDLVRPRQALTALLAAAALAAGGCGGGSDSAKTTADAIPATTAPAPANTPPADTAPAPADTPPADTATTPADPRERLRDALLVVTNLPEGWALDATVTRYRWPHRDSRCLPQVRQPRDGVTGPLFTLNPDAPAGWMSQIVERHASAAAARKALAAFSSPRARRCFMEAFRTSLRDSARESGVGTRLRSFRSVPLELPSVLYGDESAGLRLCALARFESGVYDGSVVTYCDDRVIVRSGALTTLLDLNTSDSLDASLADSLGTSAAELLEDAAR